MLLLKNLNQNYIPCERGIMIDNICSLFVKAKILEIGGNRGDITHQLLALDPAHVTVVENDDKWCKILQKRFEGRQVTVESNDILDEQFVATLSRYDIIILKEMLNALPFEIYSALFQNCFKLLEKSGKLIIVDYSPLVIFRHFFVRLVRQPWDLVKNFRRVRTNVMLKKTLRKRQLMEFFPPSNFTVHYYYGLDFLNEFDSKAHKILEYVFPCKYVAVIEFVDKIQYE